MKVFTGKFIADEDDTAKLRALEVDRGYLSVSLDRARSVRNMAYALKKSEGLVFRSKKRGNEVFIWRVK